MNKRPRFDAGLVCAAVAHAIALKRTQHRLARACGVTQAAISSAKLGGRLSPQLAMAIHRATAGAVPGSALRPDLWRRPEDVPVERPRKCAKSYDANLPWSRRELAEMDRAFCDAMRREIARGSERPREPAGKRASARAIRRLQPTPRHSGASSAAALCAEAGEPDRFW